MLIGWVQLACSLLNQSICGEEWLRAVAGQARVTGSTPEGWDREHHHVRDSSSYSLQNTGCCPATSPLRCKWRGMG